MPTDGVGVGEACLELGSGDGDGAGTGFFNFEPGAGFCDAGVALGERAGVDRSESVSLNLLLLGVEDLTLAVPFFV